MQRAIERRGRRRFVTIWGELRAPHDKGVRKLTRSFLAVVVPDILISEQQDVEIEFKSHDFAQPSRRP